jgi:hypothetical protein
LFGAAVLAIDVVHPTWLIAPQESPHFDRHITAAWLAVTLWDAPCCSSRAVSLPRAIESTCPDRKRRSATGRHSILLRWNHEIKMRGFLRPGWSLLHRISATEKRLLIRPLGLLRNSCRPCENSPSRRRSATLIRPGLADHNNDPLHGSGTHRYCAARACHRVFTQSACVLHGCKCANGMLPSTRACTCRTVRRHDDDLDRERGTSYRHCLHSPPCTALNFQTAMPLFWC